MPGTTVAQKPIKVPPRNRAVSGCGPLFVFLFGEAKRNEEKIIFKQKKKT